MRGCAILALLLSLAASRVRAGEPGFEVLVLGTHHAPAMFLGDKYTPAHIRATLENARPDVVAVESHPKWFAAGRYHVVTYEAEGVAVPWARANGLPVYGIDEKDVEDWDRRAEQKTISDVTALRSALRSGAPLAPSWFATGSGGRADVDWEHINSEEYGKSRYRGKSPDDADFAVPRDRVIARNCVQVMRKHPGKRLAVVIGAHHKPFLEILLRKRGGVRVLTLGKDVPYPTEAQVARSWTTQDLLATLGHSLDTGAGAVYRPRLKKLLAMLEKRGEAANAARYFRARILTIEGKPEAAEKLLGGLRESSAAPYPFPMRSWRMRYSLSEAARIEKARLLIARGEEGRAKPLLESVAAALDARLAKLTKSHATAHRTVLALKDPGFEAGKRAGDIFAGWDTYLPTGHGLLRFAGDRETKVEGSCSLRLEVAEANPKGYGFSVRQAARIAAPLWKAERLTFGLVIRGEQVETATIAITQPWYGPPHTYASTTVDLSSGEWTRAEVSCPLPPRGDFYVHVKFDGPAGARLWLDDGTRIPIEYDTVPSEWSRLAIAAHFPRFLLAGSPAPKTGLRDPGFEAATLARMPREGWFCGDVGLGLIQTKPDPVTKAEGERSLFVQVLKAREVGQSAVSQVLGVPSDRPMEFSVVLRSAAAETVTIQICEVVTNTKLRPVATRLIPVKPGTWSRHTLRFRTSAGRSRASIHIYLPPRKGAKVWIDDARLARVE
ncbi:MAG: hypothetical protein ACYSUM_15370 [Planctomycetota bacterium]|jgi:hypothetical protein